MSSFLKYALLALTAVLVPPMVALVTATLAVEDLARSGSHTVLATAETVALSRTLVEDLTRMERLAKTRRAMGDDAEYAKLYEEQREDFVVAASRIPSSSSPRPSRRGSRPPRHRERWSTPRSTATRWTPSTTRPQ